jgi:hypothetical protein
MVFMTDPRTTTLKTRTKAPYAIVYVGGLMIEAYVAGYAYSTEAAERRVRKARGTLAYGPVVAGKVTVTMPAPPGPKTVTMPSIFPGGAPVEAEVITVPAVR